MDLAIYLEEQLNLPKEYASVLDEHIKKEELPRGYKLVPFGSLTKKVYFIEKGLLRLYYLKGHKDITAAFFKENSFAIPVECVFFDIPYPYELELLENSVIRSISYEKAENYVSQYPEADKFIRLLLFTAIKGQGDRLLSLQFQSAQERYQNLLDSDPDILLRAPLGQVASYLGITQQTLSVIRGRRDNLD